MAVGPRQLALDYRRVEPAAVIRHLHGEPIFLCLQLNFNRGAACVPRGIVDAFLEDQKDLTPCVHSQFGVLRGFGGAKVQADVAGHEHIARELAHMLGQIAKAIVVRIHSPDDLAHAIHQFPRDAGNANQRLFGQVISAGQFHARYFAEHSDLGEAGANVVVEIGRDPVTNPLQLQQARHTIPV